VSCTCQNGLHGEQLAVPSAPAKHGGRISNSPSHFCAIQVICRLPASGNLRFEQMSFVGKRIIYPMTLIMGAVRRIFSTNTYLQYKLDPSLPSNFFLNVITTAEWKSSCFTHSQKYPNSPVEVHLIHLNKGLLLSLHFMAWYIQVHQSEGVPMILRISPYNISLLETWRSSRWPMFSSSFFSLHRAKQASSSSSEVWSNENNGGGVTVPAEQSNMIREK